MQDELIVIDHLEDQIIDNPDALTRRELNDSSLDETFQKKLNARAEQIASLKNGVSDDTENDTERGASCNNYQFLITKTDLKYEYKDFGDLETELEEWFVFNDFQLIGLQLLSIGAGGIEKQIERFLENPLSGDNACLDSVLYFALGGYKQCKRKEEQIFNIVQNCTSLIEKGVIESAINMLKQFLKERLSMNHLSGEKLSISAENSACYFKILTLVYFMVNTAICSKEGPLHKILSESLKQLDSMTHIVRSIERWTWRPSKHYRARNLLMLLWKLILLEMGGTEQLKKVDDFLVKKHGIVNKRGTNLKGNKLTCSPLDYFTFREDLLDKYPLSNQEKSDLEKKRFDLSSLRDSLQEKSSVDDNYDYFMAMNSHSSSMSNLIENPRPNKAHTILSQLPAQTVHIATPVPSPPSTPSEYMTGGEKIRKLYQINQGMPFIYPSSNEVSVPYAIEEAKTILKNSVYESYANKQLWNERHKFMVQERGYIEGQDIDKESRDEFSYDEKLLEEYPNNHSEINSLLRVEQFYSSNLSRMICLVQALTNTIESTHFDYNLNFAEWELNPETSYFQTVAQHEESARDKVKLLIMQQLEVLKTKEITLKACSSIVFLLLEWFKKSHVLKYYYFTSILYDLQYFEVVFDYLTKSFNNSDLQQMNKANDDKGIDDAMSEYERLISQNQLMNPQIRLPKFEFFKNCLGQIPEDTKVELINKTPLLKFPSRIDSSNVSRITLDKFNNNFCFIIINLLNITKKVLIKNSTQRIFTLNELKPSELFKIILLNYNNQWLNKPVLKILKKLIPYQGRKWKSFNMDLISQVYLNCNLSLRDTWLSGKDLENDFNNSVDQEIALRALLQFYNKNNYPEQMELLGFNDFETETNSHDYPTS